MKVDKFRTVIIYIIIILLGLVCLLPLLNIVAISFSSSAAVEGNMVGLIPVGFSTAAYEKILEDSQFWHSFLESEPLRWRVSRTLQTRSRVSYPGAG